MPGVEEKSMPPKTYEDENVTDDESDLELDNEGVVDADDEPPQKASFIVLRFCYYLFLRLVSCCKARNVMESALKLIIIMHFLTDG